MHPDVTYTLYTADGQEQVHKGLYAIVDGGYPKWYVLISPMKHTTEPDALLWTERLESVRKNVECCFGILKRRFKILGVPFHCRSPDFIDSVFRACCALHNMLLRHDKLHTIGRLPTDWQASKDLEERARLEKTRCTHVVRGPNRASNTATDPAFNKRREALIAHMKEARRRNELKWKRPAAEVRPRGHALVSTSEDEHSE